jgi:hypothetical protein
MSDQTETSTEQPQVPEQILLAYGMVFNQLLQSDKFRLFMDTYYTVQKLVDEEKKEITLQVIENPPEVIGKKITEAAALAMKEEAGKIQIVSESMGKKIVDQAVAGAKKKR